MSHAIDYSGNRFQCKGTIHMTKKVHRWLMILLLSAMVMALAIFGIAETSTGNLTIFGMTAVGITAILLIAGIEIRRIEYRGFKIIFESDDNE